MNQAKHVKLNGSERAVMPGAQVARAADPDECVELTVKIRGKAAMPPLEGRPSDILTHAQLIEKYGAADADIQLVRKTLEQYGLDFVEANAGARSIQFCGPVSAIEKAFQVKLFHYTHEQGDYRGRAGAIHLPAELDGVVEGVFGLDTRRVVQRRGGHGHAARELTAATIARRPWFFPAELAALYDFPAGDGAGQCVGLLEFGGGYFPADLQAFCQTAKVGVPKVTAVSVNHTATNRHDGAEGEVMLDVEVVAGVCPKADIAVYFSKFSEAGWVAAIDAAIHDQKNNPSVISISWGYAEDYAGAWTTAAINAVNQTLQQAAMLGKTVCVAAGDDGSSDAQTDGHAHVNFPATSPYVLAVGGTTVRKAAGNVTEVAWKDGSGVRPNGGSTGGGVSTRIPRPAWQHNVAVQSVNPGAMAGRVVPDIAADASANTGYWTVVDGQGEPSGGTSASSPLWAALIARINAKLPQGKAAGYLTPLLYANVAGGTMGSTCCKDITSGNNVTAAVGGYYAQAGYDAVTGWGAPNGNKLLAALTTMVAGAGGANT